MTSKDYRESRKNFFREVMNRYEKQLGHPMKLKSRLHEEVIHRMALSNASRPFCTTQVIGEVLTKDHSSIVHYQKEHHPMLKHSAYYRSRFREALRIVDETSTEYDVHPSSLGKNGPNLDGQIKVLTDIILDLENLLNRLEVSRENAKAIWKRRLEAIHLPRSGSYRKGGRKKTQTEI
jgi:hypothetical protein